ncbi:alpha/beta fold hydrolase [Kutzneria sp. NPDC052558]|uniref:alpha/beta fold hydrolase n=1 Tax=Kutzneria sp. NPDC052558 TaxID=3364121 RepID=UPI0037CC18CC
MQATSRFAVAAAALLAAISVTPAAEAAPAAEIAWGPCHSFILVVAGAQCGLLSVPLDHDDPGGPTIQLALSRVPHKVPDAQYQGVLITEPGGPGGSGLDLAATGTQLPDHAGDAYDWIGFDPRGVGSSVPKLTCQADYMDFNRPGYLPLNDVQTQTWLNRASNYAAACAVANPALLPHMRTADTARDMDSIRAALNAPQTSLYGFSYGTYLAQVYSSLFPQRVRRMVLDSTVDPSGVFYRDNLDQDVALDRNLRLWFGWLAEHDDVYHLGRTESAVEKVFNRQLLTVAQAPAGGVIGPDELMDVVQQAAYYQLSWLTLGNALAKFVNQGDTATMKSLFTRIDGVGDDNGYAAYLAVQCTDVQWPTSWQRWQSDAWRTFARAPYFAWGNAWFNAPCLFWPARAGTPVPVDGRGVGGVLMIDETLDGATPFSGSLEVRRRYPGASLIAEPGGTSHAVTPRGNACVDNKISSYLATGALPPRRPGDGPDLTCRPLPRPTP